MRYFVQLAYQGTRYCGWQRQPHQPSVQQTLEEALTTVLRRPVELTGCGRTDAGVHASRYFAHFDGPEKVPARLAYALNQILPPDIAVYRLWQMHDQAHARFDAIRRSYVYRIALEKDPFHLHTRWQYPRARKADPALLEASAALLTGFDLFFPFCKTDHSAHTYRCEVYEARWQFGDREWQFHISADRFLRGMVRLIVGACLNVAFGKLSLQALRAALQQQRRLVPSWSVPPDGLFLCDIRYPWRFEEFPLVSEDAAATH